MLCIALKGTPKRHLQSELCGKLTLNEPRPLAKYLPYKELASLFRYAENAGKLM
uniref:Uncharacterized protein n=1 Tax=uncultured bacterium contig00004 TaxID=1181496 RepID=A0A806KMI0_9BACT|nr:hypothetical protein [uncultured bacterium contig00004]